MSIINLYQQPKRKHQRLLVLTFCSYALVLMAQILCYHFVFFVRGYKKLNMSKVDTTKGYVTKPKPKAGYKIESYYCECGCKKGYYHYVKRATAKQIAYNGSELAKAVNKTQHIGINARLAPICCYHFVLQAWAN